jgi:hypothetical protein
VTGRVIPASFQTPRLLALLNNAAVGLSLASVVTPVLGMIIPGGLQGVLSGAPTLLCGVLWAWLLRRPETLARSSLRWGWVASVPLAMLNAALTAGLLMIESGRDALMRFIWGLFLGATFGAIVWIPALLVTLLCFGVPIASAQRLAKKGLAGAERGEWIVGLACVAMSAVGLVLSFDLPSIGATTNAAARVFIALGLLTGASSTTLSWLREARRRAFVADAEAGNLKGYRVDTTDEGKVLVRIAAQGKGYRVADFEEDVFELDAEGEAVRPKRTGEANRG